jgi:cytoskeleton-associated protein 5
MDLILKFMTLKFVETNPTFHLKCFETLQHLLHFLEAENLSLSDYEANVFLPIFLSKTGDNKETVRGLVRSIMRSISLVYPASKILPFLFASLNSKNSRVRSECLDEMAGLLHRHGMGVVNPQKVMPPIAKLVGERDASVRSAAINVLLQAYLALGDLEALYKLTGPLPTKEKALLEERVKRAKPQAGPSNVPEAMEIDTPRKDREIRDVEMVWANHPLLHAFSLLFFSFFFFFG